ncbi:cytoplasmic 60S subunit biogenesis factor ZNF622 [Procambarus clarkii]|uniref:cytoplasmic 60S subunit biogenesis factor ZNF622 n=1 Tax=Procambarus clarkii TaxID=6728 RepID=UPI001E678822|nr:zinc finger protein 622-like [Procambarus clarkii]
MATFTCLSCHVAFSDGDGQRDHFRSDWHRYNLKRKVAELPPVSRETYNERVAQSQPQQTTSIALKKIPCRPCKKTFTNQNAYDNHMKSKKHMEVVISHAEETNNKKNMHHHANHKQEEADEEDDEDMEIEEVDSDEWEGEAIELLDCLFCSHHSNTLEEELHHMTEKHSFFVPDLEFCVDVAGLITYLGEKIGCGFECLSCKWSARRCPTLDSIRKHIIDKSHCKLVLEGDSLVEFAEFYDYSSSYPDAGEGAGPDDEVQQAVIPGDGFELVLPSGATVGHRSLCRYYRQKIDPNRQAVVVKKKSGAAFHSVMSKYRALGWNGATRADIVRKSRDLQFMVKMQNKHNMKLAVKGNKLFKPRPQNPI